MYTFFHEIEETFNLVLENLDRYSMLMNHGIPSAYDRVPSTTTSLIRVNNDQANPLNLGEKIVNAITDEQDDLKFIKKYTSIINSLPVMEKEVIVYRYLKHYTFQQIIDGYQNINAITNPSLYINRACINIALLDEEIPFTVNDYIQIKTRESNKKNNYTIYKKKVLLYLQQYKSYIEGLNINKCDIDIIKIAKCLKCLAETDKKWLLKYANRENETFTADRYRRIRRGILSFIYLYDEFDYSNEEYLEAMKLTGRGWQKSYNYVQKKKKEIFGEHSYENDQI